MCGINGIISSRIPKESIARGIIQMNTAISHRGPDDSGISFSSIDSFSIAFGQARLSIIDLSEAGHQPMFYERTIGAWNETFHPSERYDLSIVFNGEIYNYLDVRKELEGIGYVFATKSDTETILAGYLAWGEKCVEKFNGMWAFCIHDIANQKFFCSRDRFGKKPFYYYHTDTDFIFSSELKGILTHEELKINREENLHKDALDFYFTTGNIPSPLTIYKNISKLEAGHNLVLTIKSNAIEAQKTRYYDLAPYAPIEDKNALIEEGRMLLDDATRIRMFSADVPVGAFLSGGLDSSSVVAMMTKYTEKSKLHTFSIGFDGKYDETEYIDIVKNAFGTNHHHEYFREADFQKLLPEIYHYYDEPFADYSNFPTMFVSVIARKYVTVSLSGDGGDEVFGGYMMHQVAAQMDILYGLPRFLRKLFFTIIPATKDNLSPFSKLKEAFRVSLFPKEEFYAELGASTLYRPQVYREWTVGVLRELLEKNHGNFVQSIIDFDLMYNTLADNFLVKVDRASMSQALEVRSPFLDYRFIEYARKIPTKWKVSLRKTKILMRDIIQGIVPDTIVNRGKKGFEPPIKDWILNPQYMDIIRKGVEDLHTSQILSDEWYMFYKNSVLDSTNQIANIAKIKLFLFLKWKEKWLL